MKEVRIILKLENRQDEYEIITWVSTRYSPSDKKSLIFVIKLFITFCNEAA